MYLSRIPLRIPRDFSSSATTPSHKWLLRGGFMYQHSAGIYTFGPLLNRAFEKLKVLISNRLEEAGASNVLFPLLQPRELWQESGRWDQYIAGGTMYTTASRQEAVFALAPTAEEVALDYVKHMVSSPKQLPLMVFQHGHKFRDELRPRSGLLRGREFHMMDAYSFAVDADGLDRSYAAMREAYIAIFNLLGLEFQPVVASNGDMGGSASEEFMAFTDSGEDDVMIDADGNAFNKEVNPDSSKDYTVRKGLEIGHIFKLGARYSEAMAFLMDTPAGRKPVLMGCYGIGTSRLLAALVEQNHDDKGIIWPECVAPYAVTVLPLSKDGDILEMADRVRLLLAKNGGDALIDDRNLSAGVKFADADILGFPYQIILGKNAKDGDCEFVHRRTGKRDIISLERLADYYSQR